MLTVCYQVLTMTSTHIRIQESVKTRLSGLAQDGESFNALLTRLMDYYEGVTTDGNTSLTTVNPDVTLELTGMMQTFDDRLTALEKQFENDFKMTRGEFMNLLEKTNRELDDLGKQVNDEPVSQSIKNSPAMEITDEQREQIKSKLDQLKIERKMSVKTIADMIGYSESSFKKIKQGRQKTILQHYYNALMNL